MTSTRKKITIHDYPEHLNPFSEKTTTVPLNKTGKVFVDRLNMSGTWSSKITKRVNRSVTWIEKSWLGIEDSKKYKIQSAKSGTSVKSNHVAADSSKSVTSESAAPAQSLVADSNSNEKHDSDYQQIRERIHETIVNPTEMISSAKGDEERKEIKKKKKRPAPQPPTAAPDLCSTPSNNSNPASVCHTQTSEENPSATSPPVEDCIVSSHSPLEKSYSASCESENADSGIDSRPFSDSSAYDDPSSPSKSENEDSDAGPAESGNASANECGAVPTVSRPSRPSRSREDVEVKLPPSDENDTPKDERAEAQELSTSQPNANDDSGDDDEVFVNATTPPTPTECELDEDAIVPSPAETDKNCNNGTAVKV